METPDTAAILEPAANGNPGIMSDDAIIAAIEQQRVVLEARAEKLRAELAKIVPELKRYEKAIAVIRGESLAHPRGQSKAPKVNAKAKISDEEVTRTWEAIQGLLEDSDEFTQVQVRAITGQKSSTSSIAFEVLRQEGRIRFARQQANFKYYRLTRSAVAESA